jgi:hypothetical protein
MGVQSIVERPLPEARRRAASRFLVGVRGAQCAGDVQGSWATSPHGAELRRDLANHTDITPVVEFSEIVVERSDRCAQAREHMHRA